MLGEFINRGLVLILGYAFPAFECFKTVEKNRVEIDELRFWCQYWIIVAVLSVIERLGDILISWVPLYAEMKLAFIIYLWYPKTKGTSYVYESLLRPFVVKHETDIERNLQALRLRAWDLAIYYMQNCTELGQSAFFEVVHYVANQSARLKGVSTQKNEPGQPRGPPAAAAAPTPLHWLNNESVVSSPRHPKNNTGSSSPKRGSNNPKVTRRWLPSAPPMPPTLFRSQAPPPKSKVVQVEPTEAKTEYVQHIEEELKAEGGGPEAVERPIPNDNPIRIHLGRIIRFRRSKGQ
ncbi:hypothetical protein Nepgr_011825 [Nepenthes gracilis]|uniref:HVA22-like protein n=1 Tax=Nepenthes gracilis TaxID=150966 RepID=A0AAD3SFS9_NEPGR|nr:hypothetical protein Nepgr_011825 [Nepenthes gracilis]